MWGDKGGIGSVLCGGDEGGIGSVLCGEIREVSYVGR